MGGRELVGYDVPSLFSTWFGFSQRELAIKDLFRQVGTPGLVCYIGFFVEISL